MYDRGQFVIAKVYKSVCCHVNIHKTRFIESVKLVEIEEAYWAVIIKRKSQTQWVVLFSWVNINTNYGVY